jgi:hypothetical protein
MMPPFDQQDDGCFTEEQRGLPDVEMIHCFLVIGTPVELTLEYSKPVKIIRTNQYEPA